MAHENSTRGVEPGFYARSQELEPRAYAALPKNLNSVLLLYSLSSGNVITEPTLPIKDFKITTHT